MLLQNPTLLRDRINKFLAKQNLQLGGAYYRRVSQLYALPQPKNMKAFLSGQTDGHPASREKYAQFLLAGSSPYCLAFRLPLFDISTGILRHFSLFSQKTIYASLFSFQRKPQCCWAPKPTLPVKLLWQTFWSPPRRRLPLQQASPPVLNQTAFNLTFNPRFVKLFSLWSSTSHLDRLLVFPKTS